MSLSKANPYWSTESVFICYTLGVVLMYAILGLFIARYIDKDEENVRLKIQREESQAILERKQAELDQEKEKEAEYENENDESSRSLINVEMKDLPVKDKTRQ